MSYSSKSMKTKQNSSNKSSEITEYRNININFAWRCKKCRAWSLRQEVATVLGRVGCEGVGGDGTCLTATAATAATVLVCCQGHEGEENTQNSKQKVDCLRYSYTLTQNKTNQKNGSEFIKKRFESQEFGCDKGWIYWTEIDCDGLM